MPSEMSPHLYGLFAQAVTAAGCDVLTVLPGALRRGNCTHSPGQKLRGQLCSAFRETALIPHGERV